MNKIFLKLVMLPAAIWRGMGADTEQLRAILEVRLMMDDRKPMPIGRQRMQKKERKHGSLSNMMLFIVMGFGYMPVLIALQDRILGLTFYFSTFLFLLTFMLITDFSNVLFDTRDKFIIVPRPVNDVTMVLSRMLHVFIYLFRIVVPLSLAGWVALGVKDGWRSALMFVVPLLLMVCIAVFLVNSIYLLILKLTKPERFKDIINYFQIVFSIVFVGSFYAMRSVLNGHDGNDLLNIDINQFAWVRFTPSYWLALFWSFIGFPVQLPGTQWLFSLAIVLPVVCLFILIKYLAPQFARSIGGIDVVSSAEYTPAAVTKNVSGIRLYQKIANLVNKSDLAKAGFIITWLQTSRSRSFKMKVYPSFVYMPLYFVYLLTMNGHTTYSQAWATMADNPTYLILLYLSSLVIIQALNYISSSDQYKAAWVYYSAPVATPGQIMAGAFKAMWIKFLMPFFTILGVFIIWKWGWYTVVDIILAMINVTLFVACMVRVSYRHLPFSMQEQMNQGGSRIIKGLLSMSIPAMLGFGHYFAIDILWLKCLFMVLSAILLWLVWDSYANTQWEVIRKNEFE